MFCISHVFSLLFITQSSFNIIIIYCHYTPGRASGLYKMLYEQYHYRGENCDILAL